MAAFSCAPFEGCAASQLPIKTDYVNHGPHAPPRPHCIPELGFWIGFFEDAIADLIFGSAAYATHLRPLVRPPQLMEDVAFIRVLKLVTLFMESCYRDDSMIETRGLAFVRARDHQYINHEKGE